MVLALPKVLRYSMRPGGYKCVGEGAIGTNGVMTTAFDPE